MNRGNRLPERTIAIVAVVALLIIVPFHAHTLEDSGYEVVDRRDDNDTVRRTVRDDSGNEFELRSAEEALSDRQLGILDVITQTVFTLDALEVESMNVLFAADRADILVVPSSLEYDRRELRGYVPSGLQFTFDQVLEYDFRVLVDEYFLRFSGQYIDEEQFLSRLVDAIDDPVGFLESQRPELLAQRLDEVEEAVAGLSNAFDERRAELRAELTDTQAQLEQTRDELAATIGRLDDTRDELENTRNELAESRAEIFDLRYAVLAFNNATFFGRDRPIDEHMIDRIVELRSDNPDMERGEIRERLSEQGLDASRNEVDLVLAVFFREFD